MFTMKDANSITTGFERIWCTDVPTPQIYNEFTNGFCSKQLEIGVSKVLHVKQAAECLGQQPGSHVWVLNESV